MAKKKPVKAGAKTGPKPRPDAHKITLTIRVNTELDAWVREQGGQHPDGYAGYLRELALADRAAKQKSTG